MILPKQTIKALKEIMHRDYDVEISDEETIALGTSLLRLTRLAVTALARADENSSVAAREETFLDPKTSLQKCEPLQALG